jgi:hypothetical protein
LSILLPIITVFFVLASFIFYAMFKKKMQYWIISDIKRDVTRFFQPKPKDAIHIMFCFVDHFEPGNRDATPELQESRVDAWVNRYPELASKHRDSDGVCPQHTFFFPPHYDTHDHLEKIVNLCSRGFGEVEMHLHHDRHGPWPDDEISLKRKILDCIDAYSRYGVFCLPSGRKAYGFIHGDWALANSLKGGMHCGVNNELSILKATGCYADFTFPISNEAQPKLANTIFYARTGYDNPKSYNRKPVQITIGKKPGNALMLVQGIIGLRWKSRTKRFVPSIEQSNIDLNDYPFKARIDYWIRKGIHVKGKRNWIFIKIHTHGSREEDREVLLGKNKECDEMFNYLESKYNDGLKYSLHYVSAREMYNIVRAAEAGESGNPAIYRDYVVPRYVCLPPRKLTL